MPHDKRGKVISPGDVVRTVYNGKRKLAIVTETLEGPAANLRALVPVERVETITSYLTASEVELVDADAPR